MSRDNPSVLVIKSSLETNRPKSTIGIRIVKQGIPGARNARIDGEYLVVRKKNVFYNLINIKNSKTKAYTNDYFRETIYF